MNPEPRTEEPLSPQYSPLSEKPPVPVLPPAEENPAGPAPQSGPGAGQDEDREKESGKMPGLLVRIRKNRAFFFITQPSWRGKILRWAARALGRLRYLLAFDFFNLNVKAHFENPALTGTVAGYVSSLRMILADGGTQRRVDIEFVPVFDRECLDIRGGFGIHTSGWRLLWPVLTAVLTFPAVSTLIVWYRSGRHARKLTRQETGPSDPPGRPSKAA